MKPGTARFAPFTLAALALAVTLTACGGGSLTPRTASTPAVRGTLPAPPTARVVATGAPGPTSSLPPIVVGTPSPTPVASTPISVSSTPIAASAMTYTVVSGDNPSAIAQKLGVPLDQTLDWSRAMLALNNIAATELQVGQTLRLPANTPEHPPTPTPEPPAPGAPPPAPPNAPTATPPTGATPLPATGPAGVTITSLTSPVARGGTATLRAQSLPNLSCAIAYSTPAHTQSIADGLVTKSTDATGVVTWTWVISPATQPGTGNVAVSCGTQATTADIIIQ